jgi:hypothetical protein
VWPAQPADGNNLYAKTDNVKRKIGISVKNFCESGKKMVNFRQTLIPGWKGQYKPE